MKKVYVILTKSGTLLSRTINLFTKDEYTHASISFSQTTQPMYSIGRMHTFLNYPAHFKEEPLDKGFYKFYRNTPMGVYELEVSDEAFDRMQEFVDSLKPKAKKIQFAYVGLFLCGINIKKEFKDHYFCSQFVAEVLKRSQEVKLEKEPCLTHPIDLMKIEGIKCIYKGTIKDKANELYGLYK